MTALLELAWRIVELLTLVWDMILSWRLILTIVASLATVAVMRQSGVSVDGGSCLEVLHGSF